MLSCRLFWHIGSRVCKSLSAGGRCSCLPSPPLFPALHSTQASLSHSFWGTPPCINQSLFLRGPPKASVTRSLSLSFCGVPPGITQLLLLLGRRPGFTTPDPGYSSGHSRGLWLGRWKCLARTWACCLSHTPSPSSYPSPTSLPHPQLPLSASPPPAPPPRWRKPAPWVHRTRDPSCRTVEPAKSSPPARDMADNESCMTARPPPTLSSVPLKLLETGRLRPTPAATAEDPGPPTPGHGQPIRRSSQCRGGGREGGGR